VVGLIERRNARDNICVIVAELGFGLAFLIAASDEVTPAIFNGEAIG
jgi:hypothetical protein